MPTDATSPTAPRSSPPSTVLVQIASESVWFIMAGHAQSLGFELRRDQTLAELSARI